MHALPPAIHAPRASCDALRSRHLRPLVAVAAALWLSALPSTSQAQEGQPQSAQQFLASLDFRQGDVDLESNLAHLRLGDRYRFLGAEDSRKVLVDAWGNPPGTEALGMIIPSQYSPLDDPSWAVVVQYEEDGYVSDEDAMEIDYDEMLAQMQESSRESNRARREAGYGGVDLVGWAEPPHYESSTHKLYWAKELAFEGSDSHTLNYNIRILGRRGVLVLNAVGDMSQLGEIREGMRDVLAAVDFKPGNRYADFDPSVDKVAAYGIGALIAGKLAAKVGLLAKLGALLLAAKKLVVVAVIGLFAMIRRVFSSGARGESPAE